MKTRLRLFFMLLTWMIMSPGKGHTQNEGTAFSCDGTFYQIRQVGTTSSLFRVNRSASVYTTTAVNLTGLGSNNLGVLLNGLSYNPQDGYMYALSTTGTANNLPTSIQMYKIGQGGIQLIGTVTGMPNIQVASGTIDKDGYYYVSSQNSVGTADYNLYRFNIGAATTAARLAATPLRLRNAANSANLNVTLYDLALNPADNSLYGVFNNGTLYRINANRNSTAAPVTVIDNTQTDTNPVGTAFFDVAGNLFVYTNGTVGTPNSGGFYQVNLTNGVYTLISNIDPASVSDGASCINPDQRIDIVKEVNTITRVNATTYDIAFTLRVKNTSTVTDNNVQVNDFLWSGTAGGNNGNATGSVRANTTFSSVSGNAPNTVVVSGLTVAADPTNVNPTFSLARNASYTGVGGAPGTNTGSLLTGSQPLTAGQAAIITFTVRVTYGNNSLPAGVTNSAYATSSNVTNPTGYSQNASTGFLSSPDQLLATDRSTDGPALPIIANDDTPLPSPIFFTTSISGTVFEDINYGGGVGRSQAASAGAGVEGVRVELYASNGNFLTFTTTNSAGNYVFSTTNGTTALSANTAYQVRVVNSSVASTRNNPNTVTGLVGVQTYKSTGTVNTTNEIGGAFPTRSDLPANSGNQTLTALRNSDTNKEIESLLTVTTPLATAARPVTLGVDFGFNFSTVVNTNATGQGSLRQFIINSNALTNENLTQISSVPGVNLLEGYEYAIFMMNDGTTTTNGLRAGASSVPAGYSLTTGFTITPSAAPAAAFDPITDESTAIDGALQAALTGNKVAAAAGTTTGAEVTIDFAQRPGLFVTGANTRIASLSLTRAQGTGNSSTGQTISDGAAVTFSGANSAGSVVTDVTTTDNATAGVRLQAGATDISVTSNILRTGRSQGATSSLRDFDGSGITLDNASANTITGNTISGNAGYGITLVALTVAGETNDENTITGNTITGNGASTRTFNDAGISILTGDNNLIQANTITGNSGDGIIAMSGTSGNRLSQNNLGSNNGNGVTGNLGIDLGTNNTNLNGDGVTLNADGRTATSGANGLLSFPVFTQAKINGGNLIVTGFSRAGALIEFFVASADPTNFGEGATYLFSATEGVNDGDSRYASYSGVIGNTGSGTGLNQGAETGVSRFQFTLPISAPLAASLVANRLTATATVPATVNGLAVGNTSEFSGIILVSNGPLPVELKAFEAIASNTNANLTWSTASEKNNDHFKVERSFDGGIFEQVGQVQGRGTTSQTSNYSFIDTSVGTKHAGVVYYRLQQVDTDGTASYSPVRTVRFAAGLTAGVAAVGVYPNPATSQNRTVTLDLATLPTGTYEVSVLDAMGRIVRTQSVQGGQDQILNVQQLPTGMYLVQVRGNALNLTQRFSKQ